MNIATIIGLVFGLGILFYSAYSSSGGDLMRFLDIPGLCIVLGGTFASTFICYPLKNVLGVFQTFLQALKADELPIVNYINAVVALAKTATQKGQISLEKELTQIDNFFLQSGIQMLVDGYSKDEIQNILVTRIENIYEQQMLGVEILKTMSKFCPGFGIIGTLIGLINMLSAMGTDMSALGGAMAVALLTTLYGIFFSNLFFIPFAIKVEKRIAERIILMNVIRDGILFIKDKTPSSIVMDKLKAYTNPDNWESIKDAAK